MKKLSLIVSIVLSAGFSNAQITGGLNNSTEIQSHFIAGPDPSMMLTAPQSSASFICDTVFSFPTTDTWPAGLTFDGNNLWCNGNNNPYIYKYSLSGVAVDSVPHPASGSAGHYGGDMDFDGTNLLVMCEEIDTVYKLNPHTGAVVSRFRVASCTGNCYGIAFDGTDI